MNIVSQLQLPEWFVKNKEFCYLYLSVLFNIVICMFITSCAEKPYAASTISFYTKEKPRSIFDTAIIKDIKLVKLESDSCVVGCIDKIICHDSLLYMMDKEFAKGVYVYTTDGRFIHKISRYGHGKYEYTQLWDIFFDKDKNALCLLSRADQKVISFSPDGKRILEERKLPKMFGHILPVANGYVGYMDNYSQNPNMPYNIWTMDKSFNLIDGFLPINPQFESTSFRDLNMMSVYGENLLFKPEYVNTIYRIKDGEVCGQYKLDFDDKTLPEHTSLPRVNSPEWTRLMTEKISNVYNHMETDDYILMEFTMDLQRCLGIYKKNKRASEIASLDLYTDKYVFSFGRIKGMDQSAIYSVIDYEEVYQLWLGHNKYVNFEEKYPQQVNNIRKLFPHLEEDGNPFIAIYSLK